MMELGIPAVLLALITVISPLLTAVAVQSKWSSKVKNGVAFGVAFVIALVYLILTGGIADWSDVVTVIPAVYGLQQLVYMTLLKELSTKVEAATSVGAGEAVVVSGEVDQYQVTGNDVGQVIVLDDEGNTEAETQAEVADVAEQLPPANDGSVVNERRADTDPVG
jgi:hypothetical protein